ncbi:glucose-6-phosphate isomerase [Erythrobacter litoralis]|uniref:Glucose-6-phosphate isomerase n=1 Tax=Erythrobacter litoralis (strain HTCC2594) TaxID=314225 RepID=G6PI_ERYLH|nr:glucose-6-phosphate isomerase [Erythrobacter litoralis]Q2NB79.1 RecName: Full=Glucose-6-phosphate isomerase; Short=GPI; AltName: Full=Phosphoglucose isomerase; Short=PGI; AltName: Full=Phosphohexose isomerase; Short=PHI [Erythrobacter litoralis HTCC2594]ABC63062.1 glucose-6-phosphate isomerase [Erythrobacter litoralis HTCC2594]
MSDAETNAWDAIHRVEKRTLLELFDADSERVSKLSHRLAWGVESPGGQEAGGILFDWSKTHLTDELLDGFEALADAMDFAGAREKLLSGAKINVTEGRAAEHTAQRGTGAEASVEEAVALMGRMKALVDAIHGGAMGEVKHLIHVGIGGSALGPKLALDALTRDLALVDVHVVSNIDGVALEQAFAACDPATTLIAIASKTFTTIETMTNATSALHWLKTNGVDDPHGRVVALTANPEAAVEFGVDETRVLPFMESVGGRYSLWSSIGFPVALGAGWDEFEGMLAGAQAMDEHFASADGRANLPLLAAFADLYYTRVRGCQARACFAYDERLGLLPDYLQQLEMESNGKRVKADGTPVDGPTAPITWGGVGTDAQHAVFQLLHQGTHLVPVDFIASIAPGDDLDPAHHRILLTNCFAQGAALMAGGNMAADEKDPARVFPGDRPSATMLCDDLDAVTLGALIAFHEHRTFANAVLMGINPFDQFGVELGKKMAKDIESGGAEFDASTQALVGAAGLA